MLSCDLIQGLNHELASKMEYHTGQRYSNAVGFVRKCLRFEIVRTTVISLRTGETEVQERTC